MLRAYLPRRTSFLVCDPRIGRGLTSTDRTQRLKQLELQLAEEKKSKEAELAQVQQEHEAQLIAVKLEYETTIKVSRAVGLSRPEFLQRHLSFIDQVIQEKDEISNKCEELISELRTIQKKYTTKIKASEENHAVLLRQQKEVGVLCTIVALLMAIGIAGG